MNTNICLLAAFLWTLLLCSLGCGEVARQEVPTASSAIPGDIYTVDIRGHTYIVWNNYSYNAGSGGICHAEDCENADHRNSY